MAARAMWKADIAIGNITVPIKLYAALEDRNIHFRLLHKTDHAPVKQAMVNPDTNKPVEKEAIQRGYISSEGELVLLDEEELEALKPEPSKCIEVLHFLPAGSIDYGYYQRPYYLGPDGHEEKYQALIEALEGSEREGFARWTMRNKTYMGALRLHQGYPVLITLRHTEEVVTVDNLDVPAGKDLDKRELDMSQQLIDMLAADFEPEIYKDQYREQVMGLIHTKASGGKVRALRPAKKPASDDISKALEASLKQERRHA